MSVTKVKLKRFTAFEELDLDISPGVNIFVGKNGTGKTHLMKVIYAACDIVKSKKPFPEKLVGVFLPSERAIGRLVKRRQKSSNCTIEITRKGSKLTASFSNHSIKAESATVNGLKEWSHPSLESVYIPVKEMLSNAPGFRSLYTQREIHFEEIYADILDRAYRPQLRGPMDARRSKLLKILRKDIEGNVTVKNEEFFLRSKQGNLEFSLLAEGMRKLGLLWLLIQNGTLLEGSVLFWDEPETNLNPALFNSLVNILLELQRSGVQVILATHDYVILKEFDLQKQDSDKVRFHALYPDPESKELRCNTSLSYLDIKPNAIAETFGNLYDREVDRSMKGRTS